MSIKINDPLKPDLNNLNRYLEQINETGWFTNFGPLHDLLTKRLEEYLGVSNLLLVSNGTLALQIACRTLGLKNVITTPFTFVATSSALLWENININYSDIDSSTLNLDSALVDEHLKLNGDIDSILATHVFGNPCNVYDFDRISKSHNVKVIYDAAHAFDVKVSGKSVLNFGDASTLSFHATKLFHTIEGGAIVFNERDDYLKAKKLISFGINENGMIDSVGINAKLNEYQCAVGLVNLDNHEKTINTRVELFKLYRKLLKNHVELPLWSENSSFNGSYMPIMLKNEELKHKIKSVLFENNIQTRDYFSPSLDSVFDVECINGVEMSHNAVKRIICLPLHSYLEDKDVRQISKIIIGVAESESINSFR